MCQYALMKKGQATQKKIIDQAMLDASIRGISGLTIGSLAAELKMSKSGLFAHFGSKTGLQKAVILAIFQQYQHDIITPALKTRQGRGQIIELMQRWVYWSRHKDRPGGCPIASSLFDPTEFDAEIKQVLKQGIETLTQVFHQCIEDAKVVDLHNDIDTEHLATQLMGIYYAQHINFWLIEDELAAEKSMASVRALLIKKAD